MPEPWPSAQAPGSSGLHAHVARGLTWTVLDTWGGQLVNLLVFVVLARLLTPADFGLVALAAIFVSFAQLIVDQGLGDALIQRRDITRRHVDTAFWVALATGIALALLMIALAGPVASFFGEPDLAPILRVLSVTFVMAAFNSVQIAILRRQLAFQSLALRSIVAGLGGGAVGIVLAVAGFGAWALVGQQIAAAFLSMIAFWAVSPWRPGPGASREHFSELIRFGANVAGSDVLNYLSRNVDNLLIGSFLGSTQLGYYAVGYRVLTVTQTMLVNVARKITFPVFSRLQHDQDRLGRAFFRVSRATSALILPGYIGMAVVGPELTVTLFGARWAPAGPVAAVLFLIGPVLTVQAFSGSLLNAAGHPNIVLRIRFISSVVNIAGFIISVRFGILAVAAAFVVRGYVLLPLILYWMHSYAGIDIGAYLRQLKGIAAATVVMVVAIVAVKVLLGPSVSPAMLLVIEILCGGAGFVASLLVADPGLIVELRGLGRQARLRSPAGGSGSSSGYEDGVPSGAAPTDPPARPGS